MSLKLIESRRYRSGSARARNRKLLPIVTAAVSLCLVSPAWAVTIHSVHVDREGERIVIKGVDLNLATTVTLGGVTVPATTVTSSELEISFGSEVYSAVQWEASYNLVIDGSETLSVYIDAPIVAPPPPPPEPPPGGPDCPCISGWSASGFPKDNFSLCLYGQDGNQLWFYANRNPWTISFAFDPGNLYFDPAAPGNSVSYCVLIDNGSYSVAEPVVNIDQYSDCENWMWRNICI